jgi:hypothetical protein
MQSSVLATINEASLRAYVVWLPMLPDDNQAAATDGSALVSDSRAVHFWDVRRLLPPLFARVLGLPEGWPAWDVYLAYRAGASWGEAPPAPGFWQHQLGDLAAAPRLDGAMFAALVGELLRGSAT